MAEETDPLDRAARALHRARMARQHPKPDNFPWESLSRKEQALLRVDVRAVLEAMHEPSTEDADFIEWAAGPCPVSPDDQVAVYFVDGRHLIRSAGAFIKADTGENYWEWRCANDRDRIARYRAFAERG